MGFSHASIKLDTVSNAGLSTVITSFENKRNESNQLHRLNKRIRSAVWKGKVCPGGEHAKAKPAFRPCQPWSTSLHPGLLSLGNSRLQRQAQWMEDTSGLPRITRARTILLFHPTAQANGNFWTYIFTETYPTWMRPQVGRKYARNKQKMAT